MGHELGVNAIRALGYFLHKVLCAVYSEVRLGVLKCARAPMWGYVVVAE
jgi:hypothetical protein